MAAQRFLRVGAFGNRRAGAGPAKIDLDAGDARISVPLVDADPWVHAHAPSGDPERRCEPWRDVLPCGSVRSQRSSRHGGTQ